MFTAHKMKQMAAPVIIAAMLVGVISFYGGMKYGENKAGSAGGDQNSRASMGGARRAGGGRMQGNLTAGDIVAKDEKSITLSMRGGGGSKIVFFSDATQVMKSVSGVLSDLAIGQQVMTMGVANSDGSITAQSIRIGPPMPAGSRNGQ